LTLGGYDANRFIPHNVTFSLNPDTNAQASINSIFVSSGVGSDNITVPIQLLQPSDRVSAIIDSSTPFLWLPGPVCDRFAQVLGLTYNNTLDLYTYDGNASQHHVLANSQLSFTFSLSDLSSSPASVNITLPFAAFDLQLTYPAITNSTYGDPDASKNYFPLRRALDDSQYTIGRAFLQEAYLITDYERNLFSVHQAVHIANPLGNTNIVSIEQPTDTKFSSPGGSNSKSKPSIGAIVGIAIGTTLVLSLLSFCALFLRRRRRQRKMQSDDEKNIAPQPRSFLSRILRRDQAPTMYEAGGSNTYPTEVAADLSHERFELPAPFGPAELDSEAGTTLDGTTEIGNSTQDSANLSAYERARRKLARSQIAAAQAQAQISKETYPVEKTDSDVSNVAHYRTPDTPSCEEPLVSPIVAEPGNHGWGSLAISAGGSGSSQPSPVSPGFHSSPVSPIGPPPTYRRFNPDLANVVYAGRLPDNVQLPSVVPRVVAPDGTTIQHHPTIETPDRDDNSSLGSEYTVEEENLYGTGNSIISPPIPTPIPISILSTGSENTSDPEPASAISRSTGSGNSREHVIQPPSIQITDETPESNTIGGEAYLNRRSTRRLQGDDFVHVPQPAENRFSWEEDRISGEEGVL
jgi:hypothetical protein